MFASITGAKLTAVPYGSASQAVFDVLKGIVDGIPIEFQLTPDSEAPAEMHLYFPSLRMLCLAENCTGTMHNVLTLRGALARDSLAWSKYLDEALVRFGERTDVAIATRSRQRSQVVATRRSSSRCMEMLP